MKFTKMQGTGNDYVYVNCFQEEVEHPEALALRISDRHKGIGSDGLVLIMPSNTCDFRMRMFNSDGSESAMCGNASRCIGKYVFDKGLTTKTKITLETQAGVRQLQLFPMNGKIEKVTVDMGEPILKTIKIPVKSSHEMIINVAIDIGSEYYSVTCVSMGNPHAVIFMEGITGLSIARLGRKIENHFMFPERTNVEFAEVKSFSHVFLRVWERGAGETQACGTGACATLVAGVLNKKLNRKATMTLPGGNLEVEWDEKTNHVYLTGNAVTVFEGEIEI